MRVSREIESRPSPLQDRVPSPQPAGIRAMATCSRRRDDPVPRESDSEQDPAIAWKARRSTAVLESRYRDVAHPRGRVRTRARTPEGFVGSPLRTLGLDHLPVPDHSTLSRRARSLDVAPKATPPGGPIDLIVDSTGLQAPGEGPWDAAKHGTKRTRHRRRLHTGVDERGFIVAHCLTGRGVEDASVVGDLPSQISGEVERLTADGVHDRTTVHGLLTARAAEVVVPPEKNARVSRHGLPGLRARNITVESMRELGPREWKKRSGHHQTGTSRERLIASQAAHRRQAERSKPGGAGDGGRARHQRTRPNARAGSPTVRTRPQPSEHRVSALRPGESCNNAENVSIANPWPVGWNSDTEYNDARHRRHV